MDLEAALSNVIGALYEAALEPGLWPEALALIGGFSAAWGVQLHIWDRQGRKVPFSATAGEVSASAEAAYIAHYGALDPRVARSESMAPGEMLVCTEHFDERYVSQSEFYQDFLLPSGGRYVAGAKLIDDGTLAAVIGVHRSPDRGQFAEADLRRIRLILPHLSRAILISHSLEAARTEAQLFRVALDRLPIGILLVDTHASIILLNAYADRLLRRAEGLFSTKGKLAAKLPDDDQALQAAIRLSGGSVTVCRSGTSRPLLLLVAPLSASGASRFGYQRAAALLLVKDPEETVQPTAAIIARAFGLTKAEARVADAIARGKSLQEISDEFGVSRNTVRVQLQAILSKTGAGRQAELVRLILSLPVVTAR